MKGSCPLKTSPDWTSSQDVLGENKTWELWMTSKDGVIPEPIIGSFYFFTKENPAIAAQILDQAIPKKVKINFNYGTTIIDMISSAPESMFQNKEFKQWAVKNDVFEKLFAGEKIVRTPEQEVVAQQRLETLEALVNSVEDPNLTEVNVDPVDLQNKIRTNDIILNIAKKISPLEADKPYVIVTAKEAALMLQSSPIPYNNEPIIINKNTIYYVSDRITLDTDFAKIASPFLRLLKIKVMNDLYNKVAKTAEGQAIIERLSSKYPKVVNKESDVEPWFFKEKVILEALSLDSTNNRLLKSGTPNIQPVSKDFTNLVNNEILYQIRQAIRFNMGVEPITGKKVAAEKIKSDTTLDELSNILNFKVTEKLTREQFNAEKTDAERAEKDILDAVARDPNKQKIDEKLDDFIDSLRRRIMRQFRELSKAENKDIREALADPDKAAFLTEMLRLMRPFRKDLTEKELEQLNKIGETYKAKNLVNTLFTLEKVLLKANSELKKIQESTEDVVEKQKVAFTYQALLEDWLTFVKEGEKHLRTAGIPASSFIYGFVSRLDVLIDDGIESVKQIKEDGAVKNTVSLLNSFSTKIRAKLDKEIEDIKNKPGSDKERQRALKKLEEDREKYYFDEDKIRKLYKGELGDSNWWSNMFVAYTSDPDPIIGSFALFLKHHLSQVVSRAIYKGKGFAESLRGDMQLKNMNNVNYKKDWNNFVMVNKDKYGNDILSFTQATKDWMPDVYDLKQRIIKARKNKDKELLKYLYLEKTDMETVFNNEYTPDFYKARRGLIEMDPEAYDALEQANEKIEEFKLQNPGLIDSFENNSVLTQAIKEKERLYSIYDDNNQLKDETGQRIANSLMEHRRNTRNMYVAKERKGAFQTDLDAFIELAKIQYKNEELYDSEGNMTPRFQSIIDDWIDQNTTVRYTSEYYKYVSELYDRIAALTEKLPKKNNLGELLKEKAARLTGFRDSNGQIDPNLMDNKQDEILSRVHEIQQIIEDIKFETKDSIPEKAPTKEELDAIKAITEAFVLLDEIQYKQATEYYVDIVNEFLPTVGINGSIDVKSANGFIANTKDVEATVAKNPKFKEWFDKNHVKVRYRSRNDGKEYYRYKRTDAWTVAVPIEKEGGPEYVYKTKYIINGVEKTINAVPASKYFYFDVHPDFRTIEKGLTEEQRYERYIGKVIDNMGNYLPLTKEQAKAQGRSTAYSTKKYDRNDKGELFFTEIKNKSYVNEDYYTLISDPVNKSILDKVINYHLENQIGSDYSDRLYLNLPRIPVHENLEGIQTGALKTKWVDRLKGIKAGVMATVSGKSREEANKLSQEAGDVEEGLANAQLEEEREELTTLKDGVIDPVMDRIPVKGLSKVPIDKMSYDVIGILNFYMLQLERKKELNEINPIAKAMVDSLENADETMAKLNGVREKNQGMVEKALNLFKGGKSSRAAAVRALYNREFYGEVFSEKHLDWLNKVTGAITGGASMNYFALNLPSAIKNYWGAMWQLTVESAAGEYFNGKSMMAGKARAKKAMYEWTTRIYGGNYDTVDTQLILLMDMMQGKAEEIIPKDFSRTFARDLASVSWLYSPRKFMEMEGALQLGFSIMKHIKVEQKLDDGRIIEIPYADAFEISKEKGPTQNRLVLKPGIHSKYGIKYDAKGNPTLQSEFLKTQNIIHEKYKDLNGAFAKFEQPQAQRYFAYRLFAFMRRYFTHMFMNRFGKRRANYATEDIRTGYYVESVVAIANIVRSMGRSIPFMSPSEAASMKRMSLDILQIMIFSAIAAMLFGYDDDDEDRFEKLRAKSGALGDEDFRLDGWLSNHALVLLLKTQAENQSFIPLPGFGLKNYIDLASTTSIAFSPTITAAAQLLTDLAMHAMPGENEHLYYQRDTGPYSWQKEGSAKIWNHLFTTAGFSGSQVEPIKGLQSFETFSRM